MINNPTKQELDFRFAKFCAAMNQNHPDWNTAVIINKVNQYYFMGTMQDGMLIIKKDKKAFYFVRRSYERAEDESPLENIYDMKSYRDVLPTVGDNWGNTYLETETVTLSILERLKKYFNMRKISSLDRTLLSVRAIKTPYELEWIETSGKQHHDFLQNIVPSILKEGMSEADFVAELFENMVKNGYQGISRFSMFQTELVVGQIGFGESSLYPTNFDGPGGAYGMSPAVPLVGSRKRKLKKGDLVFVDIAFGMNGYHSDKTQVYLFGGKPTDEMINAHRACIEIETRLAELLRPEGIPSEIYNSVMSSLSTDFMKNFMGYKSRKVQFFGHGVGLHIDELPVIANGFKVPLAENMVIALEPKKGIDNVGMVGVEDTYIVTPEGGKCITVGGQDIIVV